MLCSISNALRYLTLRHVSRPVNTQLLHTIMRTMTSKAKATPTPVETHRVVRDGQEFTEVREGLARILNPVSAKSDAQKNSKGDEEVQKVFYNPIQQFNRDLTVLAIKAYGEDVIAKRKKFNENKMNKKRKRTTEGDERPQKQGKPVIGGGEVPEAVYGAANPVDATAMDTTEDNVDAVCDDAKDKKKPETHSTGTAEEPSEQATGTTNTEEQPQDGTHQRKPLPPPFTILDALSATGLRALRYVQELPFVTSVTANDLTPSAVEAIKRNAQHNGVESKINATQSDARAHMYSLISEEVAREHEANPKRFRRAPPSKKYDVIDLDPYGTAATFFDAAVHAVRDDGGLLCVTCTDSGVWASHGYSEKAFALYGGIPVKGFHSHEAGLRLIINALATSAARHGLAIEPLLSLSIDYYVRIFVRVKKSPASVKFLAGKTMIVYSCDQGCGAWETQMLLRNRKVPNNKGSGMFYKHGLSMGPTSDQFCQHCGSKMHLSGPMYAGPLHSADFIKSILDELPNASKEVYGTTTRIAGMLNTALEEMCLPPPPDNTPKHQDDELAALEPYPFYFHPSYLAGAIHCECPDEDSFRGALRGLGYEVTRSHCKPGSIKTNAPWSVIWHVMREWIRQKAPVREDKLKENSAAFRLLRLGDRSASEERSKVKVDSEVDKLEVVFNKGLGQDKSKKGLVRYQMNPKENWGPLSKAKGH
ncbi:S-adenosyl-L-methionine-dependent methyltransferase [Pseudomassariella vexata]|uniref:tRNA (guanine(26)-N(2))-dimethyltransferase n=1 Tax=Pseudomassariella vexata TaxID=1141098 RepID=A0A1Y2DUI8_9PEZI|nr:S-adenosyl-L-methionine-dependent methyltransferase [Pseudomassariella vexata]ORY62918.1 S-adenosyl-L-methionine-dependent methyltransferase [Pseudomassariella vexata]